MAFADKKGITVTAGFKLQAESMVDLRGSVDTLQERDELVTLKAAPAGLRVWVKENKTLYVYNGTAWDEITKGTGYVHPSTHPASMIVEDATHRFVTDTEKNTWNNKADKTVASATQDGLLSSEYFLKLQNLDGNLNNKVDKTTTVNGKALTGNITLSAGDVGAIPTTAKGTANGVASLDGDGKVPSSQLPSYVDDVIEGYFNGGKFYVEEDHTTQITGESGKIYVDITSGKNITYRWSGTTYVEISSSLALGETASTAFRGDRGKIAYDHSQTAHARADATLTEKSTTNGNIKINGAETVVYTHPATHPASMIEEDDDHQFVTAEEKESFAASTVFWATADDEAPTEAVPDSLLIQERKASA